MKKDLKSIKRNQTETCDVKETEKWKQTTQIRVSGHEYACVYIGLRMQAIYMHTHTMSLCAHTKSCVCMPNEP